MIEILVYEKNTYIASQLCQLLERNGYSSRAAFFPAEAEDAMSSGSISLLIASFDLFPLPKALSKLKSIISAPMSKFLEVDRLSRRYGAPCVTYPFEEDLLLSRVSSLLEDRDAEPRFATDEELMPEIIGNSEETVKLKELLLSASKVDSTVLLLGKTGTGKELAAKALHRLGKRFNKPLVAINCASFAEGLLESELFGHERGSFTGAIRKHEGKFESANGGTLFLDEIGDMSLSLQVKLLRVLESGTFFPVGSDKELNVDVRIVGATNRDLAEMVQSGLFRSDLLYRLNVITINLPELKNRKGDIAPLAKKFLTLYSEKFGKKISRFSNDALKALEKYSWPGNIRELEHMVERSVVHCKGDIISEINLEQAVQEPQAPDLGKLLELDFSSMKDKVLEHYEKEYLDALLLKEEGSIQNVANRCGVDRKTLYRKMKQYGLDKKDYR